MTDRELDALVAERVMGWVHEPSEDPDLCEWKKPDGHYDILPRYSSTWEGLGMVVEAMRERGLYLSLMDGSEGVQACFREDDGDFEYEYGVPIEQAPMAVVLAALKVLEIEA